MATQQSGTGSHDSQSKTRFGGRIKDFVHDIKVFRKESFRHLRGLKSEKDTLEQLPPSEASIRTTEESPVAGPRSLFPDKPQVRTLSVRVIVNFGEPLNYSHSQDYEASSSLQPTEELCEGLLHRIDHCSKELITRKDSSALERTGSDGLGKPLRYEIQVQILRNAAGAGPDVWATRAIRSYQRQPLGTDSAREIILSTHRMVGLFLRRHDEAFVWKDGPVQDELSQEQSTFPYHPGRVQPLASVPRSAFIERQQCFEAIPGYTVHFSITSQNHRRKPANWHNTVEINSRQLSPLTHATAESLFFDACYAVDGVFRSERKVYESEHASCVNESGCSRCKSHDGDGIEILVSVKNNIGPLFDNLERAVYARTNVFWKENAEDCVEFVQKVKTALKQVCQNTDEMVSKINDFAFSVVELRGRGWSIDEPLMFTRGPEEFLGRRSTEAILDRLQTGVADTLRGNAIAVRMTARKRGHFILDKTLVSREPIGKSANKRKSAAKAKAYVLDRLIQRIESDIDMVCKDTCSLLTRDEEPARANSVAGTITSKDSPSVRTAVTSERLSVVTMPLMGPPADTHDSTADALEPNDSNLSVKSEPLVTSSISPGQWLKVARDPETGLRQFPLVPQSWTPQQEMDFVQVDNLLRARSTRAPSTVSASKDKSISTHNRTPSDSDASQNEQESGGVPLTYPHKYQRERSHTETSTVSTRPQTPSLEFGGSPSMRSTLVITPKIHDPFTSNELEILQRFMPDVENRVLYKAAESVDTHMRRLLAPVRSASSPLLKLQLQLRELHEPIPTHYLVEEDSDYEIKSDDIVANERIPTPEGSIAGEESGGSRLATGLDMHADNSSQSGMKEAAEEQVPPQTPQRSPHLLPQQHDNTPSPASSAITDSETTVATSRSTPVTPVRPGLAALRHNRTSFGSAGYLGSFQDQRFYGMGGLRQALMSASTPPPRPFSALRPETGAAEPGRPGTAI